MMQMYTKTVTVNPSKPILPTALLMNEFFLIFLFFSFSIVNLWESMVPAHGFKVSTQLQLLTQLLRLQIAILSLP